MDVPFSEPFAFPTPQIFDDSVQQSIDVRTLQFAEQGTELRWPQCRLLSDQCLKLGFSHSLQIVAGQCSLEINGPIDARRVQNRWKTRFLVLHQLDVVQIGPKLFPQKVDGLLRIGIKCEQRFPAFDHLPTFGLRVPFGPLLQDLRQLFPLLSVLEVQCPKEVGLFRAWNEK